jgi:CBS domain-containing protein
MEDNMSVARILAVKGHEVLTTQPHRTVREAAKVMADKSIGALVVTGADGSVLGIVSERDIVHALARGGASPLDEAVSRHMTARIVSVTEEATVDSVMAKMTEGRFRHVPVIKDGRLHGLVSIGDVVKHRLAQIEGEHQALREYIATA